jgi:hypothetical protein
MSWFLFELRREGYATRELEEFPLLEAALRRAIADLMLATRADRRVSIGVGEMRGAEVDWLGELQLDDEGRPRWNSNGLGRQAPHLSER